MGAYYAKEIKSEFVHLSGNLLTAEAGRLFLNGNAIANLAELGEFYPISNPSGFESSVSYSYALASGLDGFFVPFPVILSDKPTSLSCELVHPTDNNIYAYSISNLSTSGFNLNISDDLRVNGYEILVSLNK